MFDFCNQTQRERINQRNRTERLSELLSWRLLGMHYQKARALAVERVYPELCPNPEDGPAIANWNFVEKGQLPRPKSVVSNEQPGTSGRGASDDDDDDDIDDDLGSNESDEIVIPIRPPSAEGKK